MAKVSLNVRIEQEIREQLQRLAKEENRTLSNLVETVLLDYVQRKCQTGKLKR
jgi:predicted transcriptional regulator